MSTSEQTIEHQRTQAEKAGFLLDQASPASARHSANGLKGADRSICFAAATRSSCRWVDRLGRNYQDICDTIREFMRRGVVIRTVINGITFDGATKDAMQCAIRDALIAFMAATAQAQAEGTKEAQRAGIAHARANGHELTLPPTFIQWRLELQFTLDLLKVATSRPKNEELARDAHTHLGLDFSQLGACTDFAQKHPHAP